MQVSVNTFINSMLNQQAAAVTRPVIPAPVIVPAQSKFRLYNRWSSQVGEAVIDKKGSNNVSVVNLSVDDRSRIVGIIRGRFGTGQSAARVWKAINRHFGVSHYWELTPAQIDPAIELAEAMACSAGAEGAAQAVNPPSFAQTESVRRKVSDSVLKISAQTEGKSALKSNTVGNSLQENAMQGLSDAPAGLPADVRKALENADQLLGGGVILYGEMKANMQRMKEAAAALESNLKQFRQFFESAGKAGAALDKAQRK